MKTTYNWDLPVRVTVYPSKWIYKPVTKSKIECVINTYGKQVWGIYSAVELSRIYITSITIINAPLGSVVLKLKD